MKTSAPAMASASVRAAVSRANLALYLFMPSVRPAYRTPLVSHIRMFSSFAPSRM